MRPEKISATSLEALAAAERTGRLFVSAIGLAEVRLEVAAGNLPQLVWDRLWEAVTDRQRHLTVLPVDVAVADALGQAAQADDSSMRGRIIAATRSYTSSNWCLSLWRARPTRSPE